MSAPSEAVVPDELLAVVRDVVGRQRGNPGRATITLHFGTGSMLSVVVDEPADAPTARRVERIVLGKRT